MSNLTSFVKRIRDIMRNDAGINGDAQRIEQIAWMLFLKVYDAKEFDWEFDDQKYKSIIPEKLRWRNWGNNIDLTGNELLNFVNNVLFVVLKGKNATITDGEGKVIETIEGITVTPDTPIRQKIVQATFEDANNYMKDGVLMRQIVNIINELNFDTYEETHAFGEIYETILKELQSAGSAGEFYTPRAVTDFMAKMIKPQIGESMADFACGTGGFLTSWIKQLEAVKKSKESLSAKEIDQIYTSVHAVEKKQFPYMLCVTNMLLHDLDSPDIRHGNSLNSKKLLDYTQADAYDVILMNPPYGGSEKDDVKYSFPPDYKSSETADLFLALILYRLKQNGRAAVIIPDGFLFGNDNTKNNIKKKLLTEFDLHTVIRMPQSVFAPYTSITTNILFFNNTEPQGKTWFYRVDIPSDRKHFSKTKPMELKHFDDCIQWWNHRTEITDADGNPKAKCYSTQELIDGGFNLDLCGYPHEEEVILSLQETIANYEEKRTALNADIDNLLAQITALHQQAQNGELL